MTVPQSPTPDLVDYVTDAAAQADLLSLAEIDGDLQSTGYKLHYAIDSNIIDLYVNIKNRAERSENRRIGNGEIFRDDPEDRKAHLAALLGRYLWHKLQPDQPFLLIPPIDLEVGAYMRQISLWAKPEKIDASQVEEIITQAQSQGQQLPQDEIDTLMRMLLIDNGRPLQITRIRELEETRRFLNINLLPWAEPGEVDPALAAVLAPWQRLIDMLDYAEAKSAWTKRLGADMGRDESPAMRRDADALARLEIWNRHLAKLQPKRRLIYITSDNSILRSSKNYYLSSEYSKMSFREYCIRHPKSYFEASGVLAARPDRYVKLSAPGTLQPFRSWLELLVGRYLDRRTPGDWSEYGYELEEGLTAEIRQISKKEPNAALNIRAKWHEFVNDALAVQGKSLDQEVKSDQEFIKLMMRALAHGVDVLRQAIIDTRPLVDSHMEKAWHDCVAVFTNARFLIEVISAHDGRAPARGVPRLCFEGSAPTDEFLTKARAWYQNPQTFKIDEYHRLHERINLRDSSGYNFSVAVAYLLAIGQHWQSAIFLCQHARKLGSAAVGGSLEPAEPNGREAGFLEAFCRRMMARTQADLDPLDGILQGVLDIAEAERRVDPGLDVVVERVTSERHALALSKLLFLWGSAPGVVSDRGFADAMLDLAGRMQHLVAAVPARLAALASLPTAPDLASSHPYRVSADEIRAVLNNLRRRNLVNLIGIGLLMRSTPDLRNIGAKAFIDFKGPPDTRAHSDLSYYGKVVIATATVVFGPAMERRRAYEEARTLLKSVSEHRTFPFDAARFAEFGKCLDEAMLAS